MFVRGVSSPESIILGSEIAISVVLGEERFDSGILSCSSISISFIVSASVSMDWRVLLSLTVSDCCRLNQSRELSASCVFCDEFCSWICRTLQMFVRFELDVLLNVVVFAGFVNN